MQGGCLASWLEPRPELEESCMSQVASREQEIQAEMEDCGDWKERYSFILDQATGLEPMPEALRVDANKVRGCVSQLWLYPRLEDGKLRFWAESDSLFVKGLVALMLRIYDRLPPEEILANPSNFLITSGLVQNLSPNRANGVASMLAKIQEYAAQHRA
jgi:cysteine desulfuration protein SufE